MERNFETYEGTEFEAKLFTRYTVHCSLDREFQVLIWEYDHYYLVDVKYPAHKRPVRSYIYDALQDLREFIKNDEFAGWSHSKPVYIESSDIVLNHYIKEFRLNRVPRSLFYHFL